MNTPTTLSRRDFFGTGGKALAASALAGVTLPHVHAAGSETIQLAIVGCGGRGSGAVANAMEATGSTTKLVAMADLYEDRLQMAHRNLYDKFEQRIDVPSERQFIGFDSYKKAIDSLRPGSGDIVLLTGYAGFRPAQLEYAVERGVNVFMEKSFATDPVGVRRVIAASDGQGILTERVPLSLDGKTIGVIAIFGNLPQKTEFVQTDRELFKLLGAQAAPALVNARLFTDAGRKVPGIQAFLDLED